MKNEKDIDIEKMRAELEIEFVCKNKKGKVVITDDFNNDFKAHITGYEGDLSKAEEKEIISSTFRIIVGMLYHKSISY